MSASLVGSEMCIRDSSSSPPRCIWTSASKQRSGVSPCIGQCIEGWRRPCLLYTSDAADDM
eukprot:2626-Alexandrium_andersonii.AAC.1